MAFGLGSLIGGIAGAFAPKPGVANFTQPDFVNQFSGPFGTATREGFEFDQDPNRQAAVDFANLGLEGSLADVMAGASPERIAEFQNAFLQARRPQLEEGITQQRQASEAGAAGQGITGSSADIFRRGREGELANRQRTQLFGESIMGGEALANQALQQDLAQLGATQGLSQQDFANQMAAMQGATGALRGSNQLELQRSRLANELEQKRAAQETNRRMAPWKNVIGGITAGAGFGGLSNLFGGGGVSGSAASPLGGRSFTSAF